MKIVSLSENKNVEKRVAITPEIAKKYISSGFEVCLQKNYATHLGFDDEEFKSHGVKILANEKDIIGITGTHGKTSTTALVSHIFQFNNKNVSFIYGGVSSFGYLGGHCGEDNLPLILETDEAFNTFKNILSRNSYFFPIL